MTSPKDKTVSLRTERVKRARVKAPGASQPGFPATRLRRNRRADWSRRLADEYERFTRRIDAGEETLVDPYGAEAIEEFFAVSAEAFFVAAAQLRTEEPALYDLLAAFFRQNPADLAPT